MIGRMVKKWQPFFEIQDGGDRGNGKKEKAGTRKSQNRYISSPCGGLISQPRRKTHFPFKNQTAYITVPCATVLACDNNCAESSLASPFVCRQYVAA